MANLTSMSKRRSRNWNRSNRSRNKNRSRRTWSVYDLPVIRLQSKNKLGFLNFRRGKGRGGGGVGGEEGGYPHLQT